VSYRLAVLASGRGSNLGALIRAQDQGELNTQIVGVFSDRPACAALELARQRAIPTFAQRASDYPSREAFDESMFNEIEAVQPDLIVCAGYMRFISERAVLRFKDRMINIHPSLLPKYPGLDTHSRALAAGDSEHGASVHKVIPALDAGEVIAQARVPVLAGDTSETLTDRVLVREHPLLMQCVKAISEGTIVLSGGQIHWNGKPLHKPLLLNPENQLEECK
jgi:phosphoribosylglycinamide formyltransferase-1